MSFRYDDTELLKGLQTLQGRSDMAFLAYADTAALKLQNHAKVNAPWTDRTGMARRQLAAGVEDHTGRNLIRIYLAQGVNYGIWLELANEKRFAIIQPTINLKSGEVMRGLQNLMERIGRL